MERLCVIAGLVLLSGMEVLMKGVGSGLFCVEKRVSKSEGDRKKTKNGRTKTHNDIQPREILKFNPGFPAGQLEMNGANIVHIILCVIAV